jgi:hypothetical protein
MSDYKRIFLQPGTDDTDPEFGRTWCSEQINWPGDQDLDCPGDTEYVRSDLYAALQADYAALGERCEQMRDALLAVRSQVDQWGELSCTDTAWSTLVTALRYYAADAAKGEE